MRTQVTRHDFLEMIQTVIDAVQTKVSVPVLSTALMIVENNGCSLSATGPDLYVRTHRDGTPGSEGSITFPARKTYEIVRELPETELTLEDDDGRFSISTGTGEYLFSGIPASEFPPMPQTVEGVTFSLDGSTLLRMITKVSFAASHDAAQTNLGGVYWRIKPDSMILAATDRHRLAFIRREMDTAIAKPIEAILSLRSATLLARLLKDGNTLQDVTLNQRQAYFRFDGADMFTSLIEGPYANIDTVMPGGDDVPILVPLPELLASVKRVMILSNQDHRHIRVRFNENEMTLVAVDRDSGTEAVERISIEYDGDELEIGYNASYLLEILGKVEGEHARFRLRSPSIATVIESAEQEQDESFFTLLMPLRVPEG
jgi:DNA polymerase III subunit beta